MIIKPQPTSAIMMQVSSYPYRAVDINLAMRRNITANVEANIITTTITMTSVCRLSLSEGSVLLQSACARPRDSIVMFSSYPFKHE